MTYKLHNIILLPSISVTIFIGTDLTCNYNAKRETGLMI